MDLDQRVEGNGKKINVDNYIEVHHEPDQDIGAVTEVIEEHDFIEYNKNQSKYISYFVPSSMHTDVSWAQIEVDIEKISPDAEFDLSSWEEEDEDELLGQTEETTLTIEL